MYLINCDMNSYINGNLTYIIFIDLTKAFDLLEYYLLLHKLHGIT